MVNNTSASQMGSKENTSNEQEFFGPWIYVTNRRSRKPTTIERNGGRSMSQIKGTPTNHRFAILSNLESEENMPKSTDNLSIPLQANNNHIKSNKGKKPAVCASRPISLPKLIKGKNKAFIKERFSASSSQVAAKGKKHDLMLSHSMQLGNKSKKAGKFGQHKH